MPACTARFRVVLINEKAFASMVGKHAMLTLTEKFTLQALRNQDHLHIFHCSLFLLPEHTVLALQDNAGLTGPVLQGDAVPP